MHIEKLNEESLVQEYKIVISMDELNDLTKKELLSLSTKVKMPGFRPGKVPMAMIEKKYKDSVLIDALEKLTKDGISKIVKENNLSVLDSDVKTLSGINQGKVESDVELVVKFELLPTIEIPDLSSIKLEKIKVNLSDAQIQEEKDKLLEASKEFNVDVKGAAKDGHMLVVDYELKVENDEHQENQQDFKFVLGAKQVFPDFEKEFIGVKKGKELTFNVTMPQEYGKIGGKTGEFKVTVKEVKSATLPEFNDDLAKKLNYDSADALADAIKKKLEFEVDHQIGIINKVKLFDKLEELLTFDVPKNLYEREKNILEKQLAEAAKADNEKQYDDNTISKITLRRLRIGMLLDHYAEQFSLSLTQEEMNRALFNKLVEYPQHLHQQIVDFYKQNKKASQALFSAELENKIAKDILSKVTLEEKEYSVEEFEKLVEEISNKF